MAWLHENTCLATNPWGPFSPHQALTRTLASALAPSSGGDSCRTTHSTPLTARGRGLSAIRTTCDGGLFKQPLAVFFQRLAAVVHTLHS